MLHCACDLFVVSEVVYIFLNILKVFTYVFTVFTYVFTVVYFTQSDFILRQCDLLYISWRSQSRVSPLTMHTLSSLHSHHHTRRNRIGQPASVPTTTCVVRVRVRTCTTRRSCRGCSLAPRVGARARRLSTAGARTPLAPSSRTADRLIDAYASTNPSASTAGGCRRLPHCIALPPRCLCRLRNRGGHTSDCSSRL